MWPICKADLLERATSGQAVDLDVRLGFGEAHYAAALFPLAAFLEQVDTLETFEDVALGCNGAGGTEAAVLGHRDNLVKIGNGE